ncbi:MAG TPA: hypothetical protein PKA63_09325 [Oligoflexia bacterium]|nr:hypothetical protein [Oligoflexia bacterium]HMP48854.1 hypothetical protein [Oligoflexia bacterium]
MNINYSNSFLQLRGNLLITLFVVFIPYLGNFPLVYAEDSQSNDSGGMSDPCEGSLEKERAPKGAIASYGNVGIRAAVDVDAGEASAGDEGSVIAGSILFLQSRRCEAKIMNKSECNSYSFSYRVKEIVDGKVSTKSSGSAVLKPGGERVFPFSCDMRRSYKLDIESAKAQKK